MADSFSYRQKTGECVTKYVTKVGTLKTCMPNFVNKSFTCFKLIHVNTNCQAFKYLTSSKIKCWDFNEKSINKTTNKLHAFASTKGGGVIKWDPKQSCKLALKCMTISLCTFHMVLSLQQNCTEGVGHQISAWGVGLLFANAD